MYQYQISRETFLDELPVQQVADAADTPVIQTYIMIIIIIIVIIIIRIISIIIFK